MMVQDTFESGVLTKRKCPSPSSGTSTPLSLIEKIKQSIGLENNFFSLEFFPPRTPAGAANLIGKLEKYSIIFYLLHSFVIYFVRITALYTTRSSNEINTSGLHPG
jgi:hypothetical protein